MNEILIKTNRPHYESGDTLFGLVYLSIKHPTTGHGVVISVNGNAVVSYGHKRSSLLTARPNSCRLEAEKSYINCQNVVLYRSSDPFSIGNYMFPFKFSLPAQIPSTMQVKGENECGPWMASVQYTVIANLINASDLSVAEEFQVRSTPTNVESIPVTVEENVALFKFINRKCKISAKFEKAIYQSGEEAILNLEISNSSRKEVSEVNLKLLQLLSLRRRFVSKQLTESGEEFEENENQFIMPHGEAEHLVWETTLKNNEQDFTKSLERIPVSLEGLAPTTGTHNIQCFYHLGVTVLLEKCNPLSMTVPGPIVLPPENTKWLETRMPDWTVKGEVMYPNENVAKDFRVSRNTLYGEEFFGLPGFLPL